MSAHLDALVPHHVQTGVALLVALGGAWWLTSELKWRRRTAGRPYPPGPPPTLIAGNVKDVAPMGSEGPVYAAMKDQYGPIIHMRLLWDHVIILSDIKVVEDLYINRGAIYSGRPLMPMFDLSGFGWNPALWQYTSKLKVVRNALDALLDTRRIPEYHRTITHSTAELMQSLSSSPKEFRSHTHRFAAGIALKLTYGISVTGEDDPWLKVGKNASDVTSAIFVTGAFLVNTFPWLRHVPEWFPGAGFKRQAREWTKLTTGLADLPYGWVVKHFASGKEAPTSFTTEMLSAGHDADTVKWTSGVVNFAGADTTMSSLDWFIWAATNDPTIQRAAQAELDAVVGHDRLPDLNDRAALPHVESLVWEFQRMHAIIPMSLPHRLDQDDFYNGYFIPRRSTILVNVWGILHDPAVYPNPNILIPDRFLKPDGTLDTNIPDPRKIIFGLGPRHCPGRHLADASVWLAVATLLATFDIRRARDENGEEIRPGGFKGGASLTPLPFKCEFVPRHKGVSHIIAETMTASA